MKSEWLWIVKISIVFSATVHAQAPQRFSKEQVELQQTVVNMFQALSDRDSMALKSYCCPDVTLYEYGQIWTLDTLIRKAITTNQSADFARSNTFDFITIEKDQTQAWLTYRLSSVITKDSKHVTKQWLETAVLEIHEQTWKVKHLHSTLLKEN